MRHPPEGDESGGDDDTEIYVNCVLEDQLPLAITRKMLRRETLRDPVMQQLIEDIGRGVCRPALHRYKGVFDDLTVVDQIVVREQEDKEPQLLVPGALQADVIHLAHEGHQGADKTLGLLRQTCWFPDMGRRVKNFVETCRPCQAAQPRTETEPIKQTPYPEGPWQTLHCDYKGPIGGTWYLHVLIDQYSKFPVVTVHQETSWESLKPALDEIFACHGIPEVVTSDGGPP